ncbi:MAG TPA: SRPBCC domain-containing protein [Steroidobacteraceae bacterium]
MGERFRGYAKRIDIASRIERVWRAFTDDTCLRFWCSPRAEIRPRAGGLFRANVDRITELDAHIDVFEPLRRLRLIYLPAPGLPPADVAIVDDFIFEAAPADPRYTIVRLLGSGFPNDPEWDLPYKRRRTGWEHALARLKVFVEKQMELLEKEPQA